MLDNDSEHAYTLFNMSPKTKPPLKAYREDNNLTQIAAAKKFKVSQTEWSAWERGEHVPRKTMLKRLLKETGIPAEILLGLVS